MRSLVALLVSVPILLPAQAPRPRAVAAQRTAPVVALAPRPAALRDTTPVRRRHVARAALVGAGIGFVAGAIGGTHVGLGCDVSSSDGCSTGRTRAGFMLFFGAEGAVAGAGVGALIGLLLPKS